jgi:RNA polymerase sigma factor (TIGR02999 family)
MTSGPQELTTLLINWQTGDQQAGQQLITATYEQLRRLAAHYLLNERPDHTLQPTALVHELYVKLFSQESVNWQNRAHFFAVAAQQLRRILTDYARSRVAEKRGGQRIKVSLTQVEGVIGRGEQDLLEVDEALRKLEKLDPRAAQIVELRFFGGLKETEVADVLGISLATLHRDWKLARAWLISELMPSDITRTE